MGEIAEQILEGEMCSQCGVCFAKAHGYPVLCHDCHTIDDGESGLPEATEEEL